jgi:hypothetical protein
MAAYSIYLQLPYTGGHLLISQRDGAPRDPLNCNRPLGILRCRCGDNIKMDVKYMVIEGVVWVYLAQNRDQWRALVNTVMYLRVP